MPKKKMPMPVNLNDCVLLWQMGYRTEVNDGHFIKVVQETKRKRKRLESRTNTNSIVSLMQWGVKGG